jgi:DnaJ-class molecular chaperone
MAINYYSVLGVTTNAEPAVIKAAYKALSNIYHPDKNPDNIEEANRKMVEINEAWEILSNKEKKSKYDAEFHMMSIPMMFSRMKIQMLTML